MLEQNGSVCGVHAMTDQGFLEGFWASSCDVQCKGKINIDV